MDIQVSLNLQLLSIQKSPNPDKQFYGHVRKYQDEDGKNITNWEGGDIVRAVAYDVPIPGYSTATNNNLRLWSSKAASGEFDFQKFNSGDYER